MRQTSYITGIIVVLAISMGAIFKVMHWPGGAYLLTLGVVLFVLMFLPMILASLLKSTTDKLLKKVYLLAVISLCLSFTAMLFKIMHWPGTGYLIIFGILSPFLLFLPAYIYYHTKRKLESTVEFFSILLFMIYLCVFSSLISIRESGSLLYSHFKNAELIQEGNELLLSSVKIDAKSRELFETIEGLKIQAALYADVENEVFVKNGKLDKSKVIYNLEARVGFSLGESKKFREFEEEYNYFESLNRNSLNEALFDEINVNLKSSNNEKSKFVRFSAIDLISMFSSWQNKILLIDYMNK